MKGAGVVRDVRRGRRSAELLCCVSGVALPYIGARGVGAGCLVGALAAAHSVAGAEGCRRQGQPGARRKLDPFGGAGAHVDAVGVQAASAAVRVWKQRRAILRAAVRVARCAPARSRTLW